MLADKETGTLREILFTGTSTEISRLYFSEVLPRGGYCSAYMNSEFGNSFQASLQIS